MIRFFVFHPVLTLILIGFVGLVCCVTVQFSPTSSSDYKVINHQELIKPNITSSESIPCDGLPLLEKKLEMCESEGYELIQLSTSRHGDNMTYTAVMKKRGV